MAHKNQIAIVDAWRVAEARTFFRNVWPMYVHELSAFDSGFYALDGEGRWLPDIGEDWISSTTPPQNLREVRGEEDSEQPFQRTHVITCDDRPIGFVCIGIQPFKYMPVDADVHIAEFFLIHASRGTGAATRTVALLLEQYPGRWHLQAIHDNTRAVRFWRKALASIGVDELEEHRDGGDGVFRCVAAG